MKAFFSIGLFIFTSIALAASNTNGPNNQKENRGPSHTSSVQSTPSHHESHNNPQHNTQHSDHHDDHHDGRNHHEHGRTFYFFENVIYPANPVMDDEFFETDTYNNEEENEQYPEGTWVGASNGNAPSGAILYQDSNPPTYYCRADYNQHLFYGTLVLNDACYLNSQPAIRVMQYEVLISQ